jgi:hypothetical protein
VERTFKGCQRCGDALLDEVELDMGICGYCVDAVIERDRERREWDYYHNED